MSTVVFRCDASPTIGAGHARRCGSLATALMEVGVHVVAAAVGEEAAALFARGGVPVTRLDGPSPVPGATLGESDGAAVMQLAAECGAEMVVVDHYGASSRYLRQLASTLAVGVIDDLADRDLTTADWILNPNPKASLLPYHGDGVLRMLGPAYALVRAEFAAARVRLQREFRGRATRVLITCGGGETAGAVAAIVEALPGHVSPLEIRCLIVIGGPGRDRLAAAAARSPHRVEILIDPGDVAAQMLWAEIAISAAGSTVWELACLGVPMILLALSADQADNSAAVAAAGAALEVGVGDDTALAAAVSGLVPDATRRRQLSDSGLRLVDGKGAARAAAAIRQRLTAHAGG